jgi:uncharacterized protein (DUF1697 family)
MPVLISLLRGVNIGGHHKIKMDALRALYESLGLKEVRTYIQSGNIVFKAKERDAARLASRIESAIERTYGFRPDVVIRTTAEFRKVIKGNPFAKRRGIEPGKLAVTFLADPPTDEAQANLSKIKTAPEELHIIGRELYIYFPNGMARPKIPWVQVMKTLKTTGTSRNWNTVTQLLEMAEDLETVA